MSLLMAALQNPLRQANICATCLSTGPDDALHPFTQDITIILKHLLHEFDLDGCLKLSPPDKQLKLCQLCHKTLKDMVAFKETALKSLKRLKNLWQDNLSKTVIPNSSQTQSEDTMMVPKVEPMEPDLPDTHTHEYIDIPIDIKEEIVEINYGSDRESRQSAIDMDIDNNVVKKESVLFNQNSKQIIVEILPEGNNPSANVRKVSNVNYTKIKPKNKNVSKNESKNILNPTSNTQQNASISVLPQYFGQTIGTLKPLHALPLVTMPVISGTQGATSQVKFVNLITLNAGPSKLVPISQPMFAMCPDGTTKVLNPTMPATVAYPTTRVTVPRATATNTVPRYTSKNKLLRATKSTKAPRATKSVKAPHKKSSTKSTVKTVFTTSNESKEIIEFSESESDCDSSKKVKVKKKKSSRKQHLWYITVLTREQLSQYREEKLKDPMFIRAPFKCMACGAHYHEKPRLLHHQKYCNSRSKENAEFPCSVCNCSFDTLKLYTRHFRHHTYGCHVYQCSTCQFNITSIEALSVHEHECPNKGSKEIPPMDPKMVLSRSRRQFYCPKCEYVSIHSITMLEAHYHRVHKNDCAVKCEVCGKFYSDQYTYEKHKRNRHQLGKPMAYCAACQLHFHNMSAYKMHLNTLKHASEDQFIYECDECSKKFHLKKNLEKHKQMHAVMAGEKKHVCTVCGRGYQLKRSLDAHMLRKHSVREPARCHICDVCGDAFTTSKILRQHMVRHSDARPYKCKFCDDTFKYTGALCTHMKLKHKYVKGKPYYKGKKEKAISAKNKAEHKLEKRRANKHGLESREQSKESHEQNIESHEQSIESHEQSIETQEQSMSPEDRSKETMDYDQILELQTFDNTMEN